MSTSWLLNPAVVGQSAALGLAIAGALGLGYSNIFVTAPSPENLRTLFEFIFKGLDQLEYKEHLDYDLVESTNPAFAKAIVRVNVFKNHRQVSKGATIDVAQKVFSVHIFSVANIRHVQAAVTQG